MQKLLTLAVLCCLSTLIEGQGNICPLGIYTKPEPSADPDLKTCKQYACNSCCTAELTSKLVVEPLTTVGTVNYTQCGSLSKGCSQYMSYVQCFYQCSPNLYPWLDRTRRLYNMPICGDFCDAWFDACKNDFTCVDGRDWTHGFTLSIGGKAVDQCKPGIPCRNYTQVYQNSVNFCNQMWGSAVVYTQNDGDGSCVDPANPTENEKAVKKADGPNAPFTVCETATYLDTGAIIGIVIGSLTICAFIAGGIIWYLRNKKGYSIGKKSSPKEPRESAPPKEMEELNPSSLE